MILSTSAIDARERMARAGFFYLAVTLVCAAFGAVYEIFSHGVYSYFMLYAFAFPLCGGVLPCFLFAHTRLHLPCRAGHLHRRQYRPRHPGDLWYNKPAYANILVCWRTAACLWYDLMGGTVLANLY